MTKRARGATPLEDVRARFVWHPVRVNATVQEGQRAPASRRATQRRRSRSRAPFIVLGFLVVLAGIAAAAAYAYDQSRTDRIAPGVRIGGVDVGGLSSQAARERLVQRAVLPRAADAARSTPAAHTFTLPAKT